MEILIPLLILAVPFALTLWNIAAFFEYLIQHREKNLVRTAEIAALFIGFCYLCFYVELAEIEFVGWNVQLYNNQRHSMISPDGIVTFCVVGAIALAGYLTARFVPADKQPPMISALRKTLKCRAEKYVPASESFPG